MRLLGGRARSCKLLEKLTNVEGWIRESKTGPKDAEPREETSNMV